MVRNVWPHSQICMECEHGTLECDVDNFGSACYCCDKDVLILGGEKCEQFVQSIESKISNQFEIDTVQAESVVQMVRAWKWTMISERIEKTSEEQFADFEGVYKVVFLHTYAMLPSGKVYAAWTSNQTDADVNMDAAYISLMEQEADERGFMFVQNDLNNYFVIKKIPKLKATMRIIRYAEYLLPVDMNVESDEEIKNYIADNYSQPIEDNCDDAWEVLKLEIV